MDVMVRLGGALKRLQTFILAEGLKVDFLGISGRGSILVQIFCHSCVHFDFAHLAVHMLGRLVIQGCPT